MLMKSINAIKVSLLSALLVVFVTVAAYAQTPTPAEVAHQTHAKEVEVMCSGGFYSTLEALAPIYEHETGTKIVLISGSSMGSSPTAIPTRLKRGEEADLVIMARSELDKLTAEDFTVQGSQADLVLSKIGMAVRSGEPKPDISTPEAFIDTLVNAKSIGYSASASGTYLSQELFPKLSIYDQIKDKTTMVVKDRVATWVARGDLEIGFQQVSEILPISGIDFVGTIPEEYQQVTTFSAGVAKGSKHLDEGKDLIKFLRSAEAAPIIREKGLEPAQ